MLNGYPEIVLCGVDLGSWGEDLAVDNSPALRLTNLVEELLQINGCGPFRIRLGSIDPAHIDERLVELLASQQHLCPHLHLSLQSGNTLILKRMKRRYSAEYVYDRVRILRERVPGIVFSADVMTGFPTETDAQFEDTATMLIDLGIAFPHVFSYSERAGTPAARIPADRQVPVEVRKSRAARLRALAGNLQRSIRRARLGTEAWILPESIDPGHTGYYRALADDYLHSIVPVADLQPGCWVRARYIEDRDGVLVAQPVV